MSVCWRTAVQHFSFSSRTLENVTVDLKMPEINPGDGANFNNMEQKEVEHKT